MKLLDSDTGELYEVLDGDLVHETEPYDYGSYRRAALTISREHKRAVSESERAGAALAKAEADYHRELAVAVGRLKAVHGSTIAETLAKGEEAVVKAKEDRDVCAAKDRAAMERIRLCRDDRAAALTMGAWSRAADG